MGLYRLLFAVAVLLWHCPPGIVPRFLQGNVAVQCFYAVSGFLIQYVITEKYANHAGWRKDFYLSRAWRILPLYWLFLALTILVTGDWRGLPGMIQQGWWWQAGLTVFNNLFLFGQDILRWFRLLDGELRFVPPTLIDLSQAQGISLTVMPQSWTLALEASFYLLAPFLLLRRSRWLAAIVIASVGVRYVLCQYGWFNHTWLNGFFPAEIGIFCAGALASRAWRRWFQGRGSTGFAVGSLLAVTGSCLFFLWVNFNFTGIWRFHAPPFGAPLGYWMVIALTVVTLPLAFHFSRVFPGDRFIGELSYPVYISHFVVLALLQRYSALDPTLLGAATLALTLALSVLLVVTVELPLARFRHRRYTARKLREREKKHAAGAMQATAA